jgi:hypothetical protein
MAQTVGEMSGVSPMGGLANSRLRSDCCRQERRVTTRCCARRAGEAVGAPAEGRASHSVVRHGCGEAANEDAAGEQQ